MTRKCLNTEADRQGAVPVDPPNGALDRVFDTADESANDFPDGWAANDGGAATRRWHRRRSNTSQQDSDSGPDPDPVEAIQNFEVGAITVKSSLSKREARIRMRQPSVHGLDPPFVRVMQPLPNYEFDSTTLTSRVYHSQFEVEPKDNGAASRACRLSVGAGLVDTPDGSLFHWL